MSRAGLLLLLLIACGRLDPPVACEPLTYCGRDSDCASVCPGAVCVGGVCAETSQHGVQPPDREPATTSAPMGCEVPAGPGTWLNGDAQTPPLGRQFDEEGAVWGTDESGQAHAHTVACAGWGCNLDSDCPPTLCAFSDSKLGRCVEGGCQWR